MDITVADVTTILNDSPLTFKYAVLIGIVLIIIAAAPSISVPILKTSITLSPRQSRLIGAIGAFLILTALVGLSQMSNTPPVIHAISISPPELESFSENGTPITILITASDPDCNKLFPRLFDRVVPLQYELSFIGPGTNNSIIHIQGPSDPSSCIWTADPSCAGRNFVIVNVTDRSPADSNTIWTSAQKMYTIKPINRPPNIQEIISDAESPQPIHSKIMFIAKATDPENDKLYYKFLRCPPDCDNFSIVMRNWSEDYEIIWRPNANDIGVNYIMACVSDEKIPYNRDHLEHKIQRYIIFDDS